MLGFYFFQGKTNERMRSEVLEGLQGVIGGQDGTEDGEKKIE